MPWLLYAQIIHQNSTYLKAPKNMIYTFKEEPSGLAFQVNEDFPLNYFSSNRKKLLKLYFEHEQTILKLCNDRLSFVL